MTLFYQKMKTAIGNIHIAADNNNLLAVTFSSSKWQKINKRLGEAQNSQNAITRETVLQLLQYFEKKRTEFTLPIRFTGTEFQKQTWHALLTIPYGETRSYSEQAALIGRPKAVRAVGGTNGLNPIGIIVPCHRVIGKSGKLTGYAGGLNVKEFLLRLEGSLKE
jgi:methylated-DNA-[protein]-cysteine S-methyltransferase